MEIEQLVGKLRNKISYLDDQFVEIFGQGTLDELLTCPIQLNKHRAIATACKILANDPTIPDGERIAGALMQMTGAGNAKPYEVCDD